ncbi:uncharacterized protein LOC132039223 [Lycium ferocissimum]|uniref:uncharacterized protein LOC132039223 n=1 Tax=Lycium ferocissimum TaxID=112874 RepID=UPI002814AD32|nr:uncharacterized protein LOC132039223 [Lycium ferocissimum]
MEVIATPSVTEDPTNPSLAVIPEDLGVLSQKDVILAPIKEIAEKSNNNTRTKVDNPMAAIGRRIWAALMDRNKLAAKGINLTYIPLVIQEGEVVVQLQEEDLEAENGKWKQAAIIFNSVEDRDDVIFSGSYTMFSRPIILKAWSADFDFKEEILRTILLWAKLPNLPLNIWNMLSLNRIGSGLGKPICADDCTTNVGRIFYARILVEIDITRVLPLSIKLSDPKGNKVDQTMLYDWRPVYCTKCCQLGHNCYASKPPTPE